MSAVKETMCVRVRSSILRRSSGCASKFVLAPTASQTSDSTPGHLVHGPKSRPYLGCLPVFNPIPMTRPFHSLIMLLSLTSFTPHPHPAHPDLLGSKVLRSFGIEDTSNCDINLSLKWHGHGDGCCLLSVFFLIWMHRHSAVGSSV